MEKIYDKNNNDTYTEVYSYNPAVDAEIHMFRSETGRVTQQTDAAQRIKGDFTVETGRKAANNVLHFITNSEARSLGLVCIKKLTLATLFPLSLIERYKIGLNQLQYQQTVPVFFDTKSEKFLVLMDRRFLRDVNVSELNTHGKNNIKIYTTNNNEKQFFIGVFFEDFQSRKIDLSVLETIYHNYLVTLKQGRKVIAIKTANDINNPKLFSTKHSDISAMNFAFEFSIAYQFGDNYYFTDENGNIDTTTMFHINKKKTQSTEITTKNHLNISLYGLRDNSHFYVVDYSEEQYNILTKLMERINIINEEIYNLFGAGDPDSQTDPQISFSNNHKNIKLICK